MTNIADGVIKAIAEFNFQTEVDDFSTEDSQLAGIFTQLKKHFTWFFSYFENVSRISSQLDKVMQEFKSESIQLEQVATFLRTGSERQTGDVQNSINLIEDFTNKIGEIYINSRNIISLAYNMEENNKNVHTSVNQLMLNQKKNDEALAEIFEVIERIITKTQKIGEITKLINRLSGETNLLGLNAKVEAVRAGAAGRGFSVVAEEIQRLSSESKLASVNISDTIDSVTGEINLLQKVAQRSQGIFENQSTSVNEVGEAIQQNSRFISTYIDEQKMFNSAIEEINEDEKRLIESISSIFSSIREISATSYSISSLTFNQNNSIMQLGKLDEDLSNGVESMEKQKQQVRLNYSPTKKPKIAVIFNLDIDFFDPPKREALKAAATYNYDIDFFAPKDRGSEGVKQMSGFIDTIIEQQYDGLVISPVDDKLIYQKLKELGLLGTRIVFIDSKLDNINYVSYIETNGKAAGAAAARVVMKELAGQGDVIVNTWTDVQIAAIEDRKVGFIEEIKRHSKITVHEMPVSSNPSDIEAEVTIKTMLSKVPEARFMFLTNCEWALVFTKYMRKYRPDIQVIAIDYTKDIQSAMTDGFIHFAIGQRAYSWGSMAIDFLDKSIHNRPVKRYVDTGTFEVNVHNMNIYKSFI